ncbi:MAG: alkaline phosphatase family protein [Nitrososphaerales archaeon]
MKRFREDLYIPDYDKFCISKLPRWIFDYFKYNKIDNGRLKEELEGKEKILLLIIDCLGLALLESYSFFNPKSLLSKFYKKRGYMSLESTFPSTTSTALTSLNTGLNPLEHAILGYTMFVKDFGAIINMVHFSPAVDSKRESLLDSGINLEDFLGSKTIYEKLNEEGIKSYVITRNFLKNTALSKLLHKGSEVTAYVNSSDLFVNLKNHLKSCKAPSYTFAYWDALDTLSHLHGPSSEQVYAELDTLSFGLERLLKEELNSNIAFMISSDHGSLTVDETNLIKYGEQTTLKDMLRLPPVGDARAFFLFPKHDKIDKTIDFFERNFKEQFLCISLKEALKMKLFGSGNLNMNFYDRVGELLCLARRNYALYFRFRKSFEETILKGYHGGLSYDELFVPLIFIR